MQILLRAGIFPGQNSLVNPQGLRVHRATVHDLGALKAIWKTMRLPVEQLERRLTEFQVMETADGRVGGAIGVEIVRQHARLHSEGYSDFALADAARELFWRRIGVLAANHGIFRLWTREDAPFWRQSGFQPAKREILERLPKEWIRGDGEWFTLQLKDEETIVAALEKEFAGFMDSEKKQTARVMNRARSLTIIITAIGFGIGLLCFGVALYLLVHRGLSGK